MNAVAKVESGGRRSSARPSSRLRRRRCRCRSRRTPVRRARRPLRLLLMVSLPLAMIAGGGYFWVDRRTLPGHGERQCPPVQGVDRIRHVRTHHRGQRGRERASQGGRRAVPHRSRAISHRAGAGRRRACRRTARRRAVAGRLQPGGRAGAHGGRRGRLPEDAARPADRTRQQGHQHQVGARPGHATTSPRPRTSNWRPCRASPARVPRSAAIRTSQTDKHPSVLAALATRDNAAWNLAQTTVRAPADGVISQSTAFKAGQYVTAGTPLFSLVENGDTWVEANFKETQLTHMKVGQEAEIVLDTYPSHPFKAVVDSIGAGTGSEFSLLPAQNATGNWVKVTQRIPVRLKVEDADSTLALRTGMSASVSIDTGASRGLREPVRLGCRPPNSAGHFARRARTMARAATQADEVPHRGLITLSIMLATSHAGARHHDRQCRAAVDDRRSRRFAGHHHLGADLLHRRRRDHDAGDRLALGPRSGARSCSWSPSSASSSPRWLCGLAWSLEIMVAFRLLQGVFGAAIVPLSQTFLLDINPKERHGQAMAIWGAGIMVGPIIGPTLGGWLTDSFNWRWVFFINLPVGIVAFLGMAAYLPSIAKRASRLRFLRLRHALARRRRAAADARPRRRCRLVLRRRDLDRARPGHRRVLGLHRPSAHLGRPVHRPEDLRRPQFRDRAGLHLRDRHHPAGEPGAAAADAVDDLRLSDHHHRHRHGAARRRHDDLDAPRRADRAYRRSPAIWSSPACCSRRSRSRRCPASRRRWTII